MWFVSWEVNDAKSNFGLRFGVRRAVKRRIGGGVNKYCIEVGWPK